MSRLPETSVRNGRYLLTCTASTYVEENGGKKLELNLELVDMVKRLRGCPTKLTKFSTTLPFVKGSYEETLKTFAPEDDIQIGYKVHIVDGVCDISCADINLYLGVKSADRGYVEPKKPSIGELVLVLNDGYRNYDPTFKSTIDLKLDYAMLNELRYQLGIGNTPVVDRPFANEVLALCTTISNELEHRSYLNMIREEREGYPIRRKRSMYQNAGHFIPDEPYGSDSMGSGWLSRPDGDIDFQKWENSGRIAIHAIKLG